MTMQEGLPPHIRTTLVPVSEEDAERGRHVLEDSQRLAEQILARRRGQPLPSSWEDLRQAREDRAGRL